MTERSHVALLKCFYCGEGDRILLATKFYRTKEGMQPSQDLGPCNGKVIDMEPCQKCQDWMKKGIILIGIDNSKSDPDWSTPPETEFGTGKQKHWIPSPWRTGVFTVIKDEAFKRMIEDPEIREFAMERRFMFIEHEAMKKMGLLPKENEPDRPARDAGRLESCFRTTRRRPHPP